MSCLYEAIDNGHDHENLEASFSSRSEKTILGYHSPKTESEAEESYEVCVYILYKSIVPNPSLSLGILASVQLPP